MGVELIQQITAPFSCGEVKKCVDQTKIIMFRFALSTDVNPRGEGFEMTSVSGESGLGLPVLVACL